MNSIKHRSNTAGAVLRATGVFLGLFLAVASTTQAGAPALISTNPAEPRSNQPFDLVYTLESCGDTFAPDYPEYRTVEVTGDTVRVTALHASEICPDPPPPYVPAYRWRIGPLPAGTYQLELEGYTLMGGPEKNAFPIASGEITITPVFVAPAPNVVPANGTFALWSLILLVASATLWEAHRR